MTDVAGVGGVAGGSARAPHIAVVGGGLAGISAALACADAGAAVTLYEKRKHLGGLTWSFSHDGLSMDNGQHVFLRCCTAYLDFLDRIGSAGDVELQERLDVTVLRPGSGLRTGVAQASLRRDRVRAPLHLARSLLSYGVIPFGARARFGPAALALARLDLDDPALDEETFEAWLVRHGQGPEAISGLWDLICLPTSHRPMRATSVGAGYLSACFTASEPLPPCTKPALRCASRRSSSRSSETAVRLPCARPAARLRRTASWWPSPTTARKACSLRGHCLAMSDRPSWRAPR
jgi:hypothetical protein